MMNKVLKFLDKHWIAILICLSVAAFLFNTLLFYPGYMSNDTLAMFYASRGQSPSNIAPVLLGLTWRILYILTGETSSMLFFQLAMLWSSLCLFAVYIYKKTESKKLSLLCLMIAGLPFVVNISGVIWRDNQMTFALALAFMLFLFAKDMADGKWRRILFVSIFLLSLFAALSRYNAIIGVVPMVFLFTRFSGYVNKTRWQVGAVFLFVLLTLVSFPLVEKAIGATKIDNSPGLLLDDIVRVSREDDIKNISMQDNLRQILLNIRECSVKNDVLVSNFFICHKTGDDFGILYSNSKEFKRIWIQVILNNPLRYVNYKAQMFLTILFPQSDYTYIWQPGVEPNIYGEHVKFLSLMGLNYSYVHKVGYRYLRAAFEPWFWFVLAIVILYKTLKRKTRHSFIIGTLTTSGILYILGYIPTGAAGDYRYIYWSVFAVMFAGILYMSDVQSTRTGAAPVKVRTKANRHIKARKKHS